MCKAQLNPNETKDGLLTCPYCGQIYSMKDELLEKEATITNQTYDSIEGERAFRRLFGE